MLHLGTSSESICGRLFRSSILITHGNPGNSVSLWTVCRFISFLLHLFLYVPFPLFINPLNIHRLHSHFLSLPHNKRSFYPSSSRRTTTHVYTGDFITARAYLDWFGGVMGVKSMDDWYLFKNSDYRDRGGNKFLLYPFYFFIHYL